MMSIFLITDTLSRRMMNFLLISELRLGNPRYNNEPKGAGSIQPRSAEAFRYCIYGDKALSKGDNTPAIAWYSIALAIDSTDFRPMIGLSSAYGNSGMVEQSLEWVVKYNSKKDRFPVDAQLYASWAYACSFESPEEEIKYLRQIEQSYGGPITGYLIGLAYNKMKLYEKAIPELIICIIMLLEIRAIIT